MTLETLRNEENITSPDNPKQEKIVSRRKWRKTRKVQQGFGLVEKMFYYYDKIRREVETVRSEQGYYQSGGKTGGGSSNHAFISDPTATIAMKHYQPVAKIIINADRLDEEVIAQPEKWLVVVEQTLAHFQCTQTAKVLCSRYIKNESIVKTCMDLEISDDKYYKLRDAGISYARECAIQLGLIKVF